MKKVFTKEWFSAALVRAVRTFAQVAIATVGTGAVGFLEVNWVQVVSVSGVSAILSLLTSVAGLPEVE